MIPEGIVSTGFPAVQAKMRGLGVQFDDWQQGIGRLALGKREDGLYAAGSGGVVMSLPRQVGKTYMVGMLLVALCIIFPGLTVLWTAHHSRTAGETFRSMQSLAKLPKLASHVAYVRRANGQQEIEFVNGSRIMFGARESGFGRGFSKVSVIVFDEAQILTTKALEDMVPATNAAENPLILFMGTPPKPSDPCEVFAGYREAALAGESTDVLYVEFGADEDADPDDEAQWARANPSYPVRTSAAAMKRMRALFTDEAAFRREGLGIWPVLARDEVLLPADDWAALAAPSPAAGTRPHALAVDMSHDRLMAVAACVMNAGKAHVELVAVDYAEDVFAVVPWIVERARRTVPVVIDSFSPAASLAPLLKAQGVKVVLTSSGAEMSRACGLFFDEARAGLVTHGNQDQLTAALAGARRRKIGEAGGYGLDRRDPEQNIAPLVAAVLARYGASLNKRANGTGEGRVSRERNVSPGRRAVVL